MGLEGRRGGLLLLLNEILMCEGRGRSSVGAQRGDRGGQGASPSREKVASLGQFVFFS